MRERRPLTKELLMRCCLAFVAEIRINLIDSPDIDCDTIELAAMDELKESEPDLTYIQALSYGLVALLPSSYAGLQRILALTTPKLVYEFHFSIFGALERSDFNKLEQDGIETLLSDYLREVKSTAAFAAWKAGLVLGEGWLSPRSEALLKTLMRTARNPAGRLGAINGYRFIVQRRKTFTAEEFAVLGVVAERDKNLKVREQAQFDLNRLRGIASETQ